MSTLKVDNLLNSAGNESPISIPGAAKAWVNFDGTGTVATRASFNVSSITDNGTGAYTVNFTTAMTDANYATLGTIEERGVSVHCSTTDVATQTTTAVNIGTVLGGTSTGFDCQQVNVAIFR